MVYDTILRPFWDHSGTTLVPFWDSKTIQGQSWYYSGTPGTILGHPSPTLYLPDLVLGDGLAVLLLEGHVVELDLLQQPLRLQLCHPVVRRSVGVPAVPQPVARALDPQLLHVVTLGVAIQSWGHLKVDTMGSLSEKVKLSMYLQICGKIKELIHKQWNQLNGSD